MERYQWHPKRILSYSKQRTLYVSLDELKYVICLNYVFVLFLLHNELLVHLRQQ